MPPPPPAAAIAMAASVPMPPPSPSPSRLSAGSPKQPLLRVYSFHKGPTVMKRWNTLNTLLKTPNRYLVISGVWCLIESEAYLLFSFSNLRIDTIIAT